MRCNFFQTVPQAGNRFGQRISIQYSLLICWNAHCFFVRTKALKATPGSSDQLDCLELSHVPWALSSAWSASLPPRSWLMGFVTEADGITARELLACCSPDEVVLFGLSLMKNIKTIQDK